MSDSPVDSSRSRLNVLSTSISFDLLISDISTRCNFQSSVFPIQLSKEPEKLALLYSCAPDGERITYVKYFLLGETLISSGDTPYCITLLCTMVVTSFEFKSPITI